MQNHSWNYFLALSFTFEELVQLPPLRFEFSGNLSLDSTGTKFCPKDVSKSHAQTIYTKHIHSLDRLLQVFRIASSP